VPARRPRPSAGRLWQSPNRRPASLDVAFRYEHEIGDRERDHPRRQPHGVYLESIVPFVDVVTQDSWHHVRGRRKTSPSRSATPRLGLGYPQARVYYDSWAVWGKLSDSAVAA